ncbi:hypothetical protein LTR17_014508 [Elasticomyces elasticus]|nr:hypothetical protein LTR17_014508 [Elasticomyces elasticus]
MYVSKVLTVLGVTGYVLGNPLAIRQTNTCEAGKKEYCCKGLPTAIKDLSGGTVEVITQTLGGLKSILIVAIDCEHISVFSASPYTDLSQTLGYDYA